MMSGTRCFSASKVNNSDVNLRCFFHSSIMGMDYIGHLKTPTPLWRDSRWIAGYSAWRNGRYNRWVNYAEILLWFHYL
jgi:hypothetical protein